VDDPSYRGSVAFKARNFVWQLYLVVFLPIILNRLKSFRFYSFNDMHEYLLYKLHDTPPFPNVLR
jgi:hypothetical protein